MQLPANRVQPTASGRLRERQDLLVVDDLRKTFGERTTFGKPRGTPVVALDGVSFSVRRGETFGLVGESGSGKSTIARCVLRLVEPTSGDITFDGLDVANMPPEALRKLRQRMQIVFQDPSATLDPRMSIEALVAEPLVIHSSQSKRERSDRVNRLLEMVGLGRSHLRRKPHELSGGQRQRVAIARALVLDPELLILDEPLSALDMSIQAQAVNLLADLQQRLNLTYIFITHDLPVAEYFCDRVAVIYLGKLVEATTAERLFKSPLHPYSIALFSAAPDPEVFGRPRDHVVLHGEADLSGTPSVGCRFRPRCPIGHDRGICEEVDPPLVEHSEDQLAACHFPGEMQRSSAESRGDRTRQ